MQQPSITALRDLVRSLNYVVSIHAAEELDDDQLTILDLENIILSGRIVARQRDRQTREIKCIVRGITLDGTQAEAVAKIGPTGRLVFITVYVI